MIKFNKLVNDQNYRGVIFIKVGDTIYINKGKYNGIDKVKSIDKDYVTRVTFTSKFDSSAIVITTEKYIIKLSDSASIPYYNNGWVIRNIPKSGQYSLLSGVEPDVRTSLSKIQGGYCKLEVHDEDKILEKFDDPIKFYSDSKTKYIMTTKKTSIYRKIHLVKKYNKITGKYVDKSILVEFEYNKHNFLIPYKYSGIQGTFKVPDDVTKIGKRCFSCFHNLDRVILPNHKIIFKVGALAGFELVPMELTEPFVNLKKSFSVYGGELRDPKIFVNYVPIIYIKENYFRGEKNTSCLINLKNCKIGMSFNFPILVTTKFSVRTSFESLRYKKAIVLDINESTLVLDIGTYKLIDGKLVFAG